MTRRVQYRARCIQDFEQVIPANVLEIRVTCRPDDAYPDATIATPEKRIQHKVGEIATFTNKKDRKYFMTFHEGKYEALED